MRERTYQIHLRATEKERQRYQRNAKKCGLTLSEYLRKLASGHEPKALPPLEYTKLIHLLTQMYNDFRETGDVTYAKYIAGTLSELREAISPGKVDGDPARPAAWGKEQPRSGEPFDACDKSDERRALRRGDDENLAGS